MHIPLRSRSPGIALASAILGASTVHGSLHAPSPLLPDGTWRTLSPIPLAPRQEHATVALNATTLAIVGGIVPDPLPPAGNNNNSSSNSTGFATTDLVQLYDIPSDTWTTAAPAPVSINHANAAAVGGRLYLLGGLVFTLEGAQSDQGAWVAVPDCWLYDPAADAWSALPAMPPGEARGAAVVGVALGGAGERPGIDSSYSGLGRIYLAGGLRRLDLLPVTGVQDTVDLVSAFDTASGAWVPHNATDNDNDDDDLLLPPLPAAARRLPEGRDHAAGAVVGGVLHVVGGRTRGQTNVRDTVYALDLADPGAGWAVLPGRMPTARGGLSAGAVGDRWIYTFGGEGDVASADGVFDEVEVLDTRTGVWTKLAPMARPRHGTAAVAVGGEIYIPGGGVVQGAAPVDVMDVFVPGRVH